TADLVKILALAPGYRLRRESIMDALWPDLSAEAAAANLRKAAHYARRAADLEDFISSAGGVLEVAPGHERSSDVPEFDPASHEALSSTEPSDASAAADRYAGDLLPNNPDDEWTAIDRDRLRGAHLQMLRAAGRWTQVAERDPWDEGAHRALMRAALAEDHRAEALRIFDGLRA